MPCSSSRAVLSHGCPCPHSLSLPSSSSPLSRKVPRANFLAFGVPGINSQAHSSSPFTCQLGSRQRERAGLAGLPASHLHQAPPLPALSSLSGRCHLAAGVAPERPWSTVFPHTLPSWMGPKRVCAPKNWGRAQCGVLLSRIGVDGQTDMLAQAVHQKHGGFSPNDLCSTAMHSCSHLQLNSTEAHVLYMHSPLHMQNPLHTHMGPKHNHSPLHTGSPMFSYRQECTCRHSWAHTCSSALGHTCVHINICAHMQCLVCVHPVVQCPVHIARCALMQCPGCIHTIPDAHTGVQCPVHTHRCTHTHRRIRNPQVYAHTHRVTHTRSEI